LAEGGGSVGGSIKRDTKITLLAVVLILLGVIVLAFYETTTRAGLAQQGVITIQSILAPIDAIPTGIASLITSFFNWLGHFFSSFVMAAPMFMAHVVYVVVLAC
jgi:hypothetical protein